MIIYFDGLCEPRNPRGHAFGGWRVTGLPSGELLEYGYYGRGDGMTNNVAEYRALIDGVNAVPAQGWTGPAEIIRGYSQLIIKHLTGEWRANKPHIRQLRDDVLALVSAFSSVVFTWVPRAENAVADELSREAYAQVAPG